MLDRSGAISAGQVATVRDFCPALIAPDRTWYHTWNSVLRRESRWRRFFFFLSRVVLVVVLQYGRPLVSKQKGNNNHKLTCSQLLSIWVWTITDCTSTEFNLPLTNLAHFTLSSVRVVKEKFGRRPSPQRVQQLTVDDRFECITLHSARATSPRRMVNPSSESSKY